MFITSHFSQHFIKIILPIHLLAVVLISYIDVNWFLVICFWGLISGLGIAIGFHRYLSHRNFSTSKFWHFTMIIFGCFGGQGSPIFWTALHRGNHHKFADMDKDVHSPIHGSLNSYLLWQIKFDSSKLPSFAAKDLMKSKFLIWTHENYNKIIWFSIIILGILNLSVLLSALILPMLISMHQENLINLICHKKNLGYRNFDTNDNSVNNLVMGFLFWGHGFHNNHHAKPQEWNYGHKWYEIDICKFIIPLLIRKKSSSYTW